MADANSAIGGVPEFLYQDLSPFGPLAGRGGAVRFFMLRHGIKYDEKLLAWGDWMQNHKAKTAEGPNPSGHLPIVTLNGQHLIEHHAILRRFSKQVGEYGTDVDLDYLVDRTASASNEMRDRLGEGLTDPAAKEKYLAARTEFYRVFSKYHEMDHGANSHMVGDAPSYADDLMFALLWDDSHIHNTEPLKAAPRLQQFHDAYLAQPAISAWCSAASKAAGQ
jgi:glutathione S-transferase